MTNYNAAITGNTVKSLTHNDLTKIQEKEKFRYLRQRKKDVKKLRPDRIARKPIANDPKTPASPEEPLYISGMVQQTPNTGDTKDRSEFKSTVRINPTYDWVNRRFDTIEAP